MRNILKDTTKILAAIMRVNTPQRRGLSAKFIKAAAKYSINIIIIQTINFVAISTYIFD